MKERNVRKTVSLVLAVLIVCSLPAIAMADMNTLDIPVQSGDTVTGICSRYGVPYPDSKELIMYLNNFTDPAQLNRIKVGDTLVLPSYAGASAGAEAVGATSGPIQIVAGDASKALPGDREFYYVVLYTVCPGDTLNALYSGWSMDFGSFQAQMIMTLNGMSNLNDLVVDKMIYLPVSRNDIPGMAHFTILEHTITYGENVGGICGSYGLDFGAAYATLQCFNPYMNFAEVRAGDKIYIPVIGNLPTAEITSVVNAMPDAMFFDPASMGTYGAVTDITSKSAYNYVPTPWGMMPAADWEAFCPVFPFMPDSADETAAAATGTTPALGIVRGDPGFLSYAEVYDGFAVAVADQNGGLTLRLETVDVDVCVAYTQETMQGYIPSPGDYVKVVFTPTDFQLVSILYVYNVFTGA